MNRAVVVFVATNAVQDQIHHAQPRRVIDDLPAVQHVVLQKAFLFAIQLVMGSHVVMGGQQEATRATSGIADALLRLWLHHIHHRLNQWARRKILARTTFGILRILLQQALVGIALHIGVEDGPRLLIDQIDDQAAQLGGVLDLVLRLAKDDAEHPWLLCQFL